MFKRSMISILRLALRNKYKNSIKSNKPEMTMKILSLSNNIYIKITFNNNNTLGTPLQIKKNKNCTVTDTFLCGISAAAGIFSKWNRPYSRLINRRLLIKWLIKF